MINTNSWITCPKSGAPARLRLFCFPYAGGGASIFRTWSDELPPSIEVCPVQLPGRESRLKEPAFARLPPLVDALAKAIQPYLDKPFAFFGHSMGALISFELARRLGAHYPGPVHLFVSAHDGPTVPSLRRPIHRLPEAEFVTAMRHFNGTPEAVLQNAELMQLFAPVLRADFAISETYNYLPSAPLNCPISAFGGLQDALVKRMNLAAWRDQTCRGFTLRMFPGDHFFLYSARTALLHALTQDLMQSLSCILGNRLHANTAASAAMFSM